MSAPSIAPVAEEEKEARIPPPRRFGGPVPEHETPRQLRGAVVRLAWPSIVENLLHASLQVATLALVARLGATAIAGVGVANQVMIIAISSFFAVSVATTVLIAYNIGARNLAEATSAAKQSYFVGAVLSAVVTVLGLLFAPQFIALLGAAPDVVAVGGTFLRIEAVGTIFMVTMMISGGILRGTGDTRTPMLVTGVMNFVNVGVSVPLIFGWGPIPAGGIAGAAWAHIIARILGCGVLLAICVRGSNGVSIAGWDGWVPRRDLLNRLVAIGLPNMGEALLRSGGMVIFAAAIVSLGTTAFAAQQVANLYWQLALFPGFGFATAAMTLTGQSLGAGRPERVRKVTALAAQGCLIWMTAMGLIYFAFGPWLVLPFSGDSQEIRQQAADALKVICFSLPIQAIAFTLAGSLRGAGDTRWPMLTTGLGMWLVRVPAAWVFGIALGLGVPGAYIGLILDAALLLVLNLWRYRSGRWQDARALAAAAS